MAEDNGTAPEANDVEGDKAAAGGSDVITLQAEVADLRDRLVRSLAEMENLRKRTAREIVDSRQYAVTSFARDMLNVADNLTRAIAAVPADARAADPALSNLMDGVEATERGLAQTLTKFGVRTIEAKGEKFNPEFHQAMYEVESADVPPGAVADVVQTGYTIGDRVLRPAMVAVAKVTAKPASPDAVNDARAPAGSGDGS
jgi:molecular chaperone GrpE